MTNEERKNKYMNRNIKVYPTYLALTWDLFFVWTISMMFLTTQKGLSSSQVIMLDSIQMAAGCLFCIPVSKLFAKVPAVLSTRIAMLGYGGYLLFAIFGTHYFTFVIGSICLAFGFAVTAVKCNSIITDSLDLVNRGKEYDKIYGKGLSLFDTIGAVGAVLITYAYNWNPYSAYWISFGVVVFTIVFSFILKEPSKFQSSNISIDGKVEEVKINKPAKADSYLKILTSGFVLSLLIYMFVFRGVVSIAGSSLKMYLQFLIGEGAIPVWAFGYIYGAMKLCVAISTKYQFKYNLKFGVRCLLIFNGLAIVTFLVNGVVFLINPTAIGSMITIILLSFVQNGIRSPNEIFVNNYLQVCSPKKNHEKLYALKTMASYMGYALVSMLYAGLLTTFGDNYGWTSIVYIAIMAVPIIVSVGLFIRLICRKYAQKYTIIKDEYTKD